MYVVVAINENKDAFVSFVRTKGLVNKLCDKKGMLHFSSILCSKIPEVVNAIEKEKWLLKWPELNEKGEFSKSWVECPHQVLYKFDPLFKVYCDLCKK